ncbi:unnamed protein product [Ixodes persulcatus]
MIVKLDTYDGRSPWNAFQVYFNLVEDLNGWTTASGGAFLASTLQGLALELLQNLPSGNQRDYKALEEALEERFGEKHLGRLYHATLRTQIQGGNESLSELAIDIKRLMRLSYQGCTTATLDSVAVGHFLDAIGDTEVQQFVRLSSPACMRDAVARAMEVEAMTRAVRATRRVTVPGSYQPGTSSALCSAASQHRSANFVRGNRAATTSEAISNMLALRPERRAVYGTGNTRCTM